MRLAVFALLVAASMPLVPLGALRHPGAQGAQWDERALRELAALPGEPRHVGAAAITREDVRLPTLENGSAFELTSARRAVIVPALDAPAGTEREILEAVRWFKTEAPAAVRKEWALSALLAADRSETPRLARWIAFQSPDLVVEVGSPTPTWAAVLTRDATTLGDVPVTAAPLGTALQLGVTSRLREELRGRVARQPLAIAQLLAAKYPQTASMSYIPAVSWTGMLRLSRLTGDPQWAARAREQVGPWLAGERSLFGARVPLTAIAGTIVFAEWAGADPAARGLAVQGAELAVKRNAAGLAEHGGGWTDDMFMAASVLARSARLEGRGRDIDDAARLLVDYAGRLQRPDGLFIHAAQMPAAWGRGNGFAAVALAEVLGALPTGHPAREALLAVYRRQMQALAHAQAPDGAWTNVIDEPGAFRESSATAMIFAALARGLRSGWLEATQFRPVALRAWAAVAAHITADGAIVDVCESTPGGATRRYYLDRRAIAGADDRGGAMALLAALERHELGW